MTRTAVTQPDPRPALVHGPDGFRLSGTRCTVCHYPAGRIVAPWCARCQGEVHPATFGPSGTVWSSTVLRVPLPGRTPPYVLAYVDVNDGPRVLAHVAGAHERLRVGTTVHFCGTSEDGDVLVTCGAPVGAA